MSYLARARDKNIEDMTIAELDDYNQAIKIDAVNLNVAKNKVKDWDDRIVVLSRYIADAEREFIDAVRIDGIWHNGNGYGV